MFKLVKQLVSKEGEMHFQRWRIFETNFARLYLHKISAADKDEHLHSHPWNFISLILSGSYIEETRDAMFTRRVGSIAYRAAEDLHKIAKLKKPTWTLVFAFGPRKEWGFEVDNKIIPNKQYRLLKRKNNED